MSDKKKEESENLVAIVNDLLFLVSSLFEVLNNLINHNQASPGILKEVKEKLIKAQNTFYGKEG